MLKLFYVIFMNLHRAPYMIPRMRAEADHPQRYTEEQALFARAACHLSVKQDREKLTL